MIMTHFMYFMLLQTFHKSFTILFCYKMHKQNLLSLKKEKEIEYHVVLQQPQSNVHYVLAQTSCHLANVKVIA